MFKTIQKQLCVRKDREYSRQAAVSAVFGQGKVLELQWDRQWGHYPSQGLRNRREQGTRGDATGQRYRAPQDLNQTLLVFSLVNQ